MHSAFTIALPPSFPLFKRVLLSLPCGGLHMTHHGCRPWIVILRWFRMNPSLLADYLIVCFGSRFCWLIWGSEKTPEGSEAGEQTDAEPTTETIATHCFSPWPWSLKGLSFSWMQAHALFTFEVLLALFRIYVKVLSFCLRPCLIYEHSLGT